MAYKWIDFPSGWRYGFPKCVEETSDIKQILIESGYPKKDIDFALSCMRMWNEDTK